MRQAVHLAVQSRILLGCIEHRRNEQLGLDLAHVHRLVDTEFLLRTDDAVLRRLREVEPRPAGSAQLRDHFFVVRQRQLDVDAGFLLKLRDDVRRNVVGPGDDLELVVLGEPGRGQADGGQAHGQQSPQDA